MANTARTFPFSDRQSCQNLPSQLLDCGRGSNAGNAGLSGALYSLQVKGLTWLLTWEEYKLHALNSAVTVIFLGLATCREHQVLTSILHRRQEEAELGARPAQGRGVAVLRQLHLGSAACFHSSLIKNKGDYSDPHLPLFFPIYSVSSEIYCLLSPTKTTRMTMSLKDWF